MNGSTSTLARLLRCAAYALPGQWSLDGNYGAVVSTEPKENTDDGYGGVLVGESMPPSVRLYLVLAQPRNIERLVDALEEMVQLQKRHSLLIGALQGLHDEKTIEGKSELVEYGLKRDDALNVRGRSGYFPTFDEWRKARREDAEKDAVLP